MPGYPPQGMPAGLRLWLKADAGVTLSGANVTLWADQSGNGNDGATATASPTFTASGINGLPSVIFSNDVSSATPQFLIGSKNILPDDSARTVFIVAKLSDVGNYACFLATRRSGLVQNLLSGTAFSVALWYHNEAGLNETTTFVPATATTYVMEWGWDGNFSHLFTSVVNGTSYTVAGSAVASEASATAGYYFGGVRSFDQFCLGLHAQVGEVMIFDHVLAAADSTQVRAYLNGRWG